MSNRFRDGITLLVKQHEITTFVLRDLDARGKTRDSNYMLNDAENGVDRCRYVRTCL